MNNLLNIANTLPLSEAVPTIAISSILLTSEDRPHPLDVRVTVPIIGSNLPVILFSHGDGPSLYLPSKDGYAPLVNFYAEQGFVVIQPTHANSKVAGFSHDMPGAPLFWRARIDEMKLILDKLEEIENQVPSLKGRMNKKNIAAVGHSMGSQTVGMLLGARLNDTKRPEDTDVNVFEPRIKVGVLLTPPGNGGDNLSEFARENFSELNPDYSHLITNSLAVVGDADVNPFMTVRGADWYTDAYNEAPGINAMLTLHGAQHGLGGIAGFDAKETGDDENPDTLASTQRVTVAYLKSFFDQSSLAWESTLAAFKGPAASIGFVIEKHNVS